MTLDQFLVKLVDVIVNPLIRLMFAAALVVFLWGVVDYIRGAGSPESREKGTQHIIWGIVGLFIMVTVFGIIELVKNTVFAKPS